MKSAGDKSERNREPIRNAISIAAMRVGREKRAVRADRITALADGDEMHGVVGVVADLKGVSGLALFSATVGAVKDPGVLGMVNDVLDPNLRVGGKAF